MSYGLGFLSATAPWTGSVAASISYTDYAQNTNNTTTYNFTNVACGTASSTRIVAIVAFASGIGGEISSLKINGTSATKAVGLYWSAETTSMSIYYLNVTTGTTCSVEVNTPDAAGRCAITVYSITPGYSATPSFTNTATNTGTMSITEVTGGVTIYGYTRDNTTAYTVTRDSVTITPDASTSVGGPNLIKVGSTTVTGNPNASSSATYAASASQVSVVAAHWR